MANRSMTRIFVSGPLSHGDVYENVLKAQQVGAELIALGFAPFIPHLYHYLHVVNPIDYERIMAVDQAWLAQADGVVRIPGYSPGADREVALAKAQGIPVFDMVADVCTYFRYDERDTNP